MSRLASFAQAACQWARNRQQRPHCLCELQIRGIEHQKRGIERQKITPAGRRCRHSRIARRVASPLRQSARPTAVRRAPNGLDAQPGGMFHAVVQFVNRRKPVQAKSGQRGRVSILYFSSTALFQQTNDQEVAGRLRTAPCEAQAEHLVLCTRGTEGPN